MAKPVGGKVFVKVDGELLFVRGNVTTNIGQQVMRESVVGVDQVHGYTEKAIVPFIQCDITEKPEFPLSKINAVTDSTVTAELADGRTLILRNAWHVGEPERNPEEGSITVRFEGLSGEEA
jgi:hypothetical protein